MLQAVSIMGHDSVIDFLRRMFLIIPAFIIRYYRGGGILRPWNSKCEWFKLRQIHEILYPWIILYIHYSYGYTNGYMVI